MKQFMSAVENSNSHRVRPWITSEHFDESTVFLYLPNGSFDLVVITVSFDIEKEKIFPILPFGRPALDLAHAQLVPIEWLDC